MFEEHYTPQDEKYIDTIIGNFLDEGLDKLLIILDFDGTITSSSSDNKGNYTIIGQIKNSELLGKAYALESAQLYNFYKKVELAKDITIEEKSIYMTGRRYKHLELLKKFGLNSERLNQIVASQHLNYRKKFHDFIDLTYKFKIPVLIVSAGMTELIKLYLDKEKRLYPTIKIISNHLNLNNHNTGFSKVINRYNKENIDFSSYSLNDDILYFRKNILLIGDSLEDSLVANCLNHNNLLKIGFFSANCGNTLNEYKDMYDIVLESNAGFDEPINILNIF